MPPRPRLGMCAPPTIDPDLAPRRDVRLDGLAIERALPYNQTRRLNAFFVAEIGQWNST